MPEGISRLPVVFMIRTREMMGVGLGGGGVQATSLQVHSSSLGTSSSVEHEHDTDEDVEEDDPSSVDESDKVESDVVFAKAASALPRLCDVYVISLVSLVSFSVVWSGSTRMLIFLVEARNF